MDLTEVLGLVERAKDGDKATFAELYDEHASRIHRFIKIRLPNDTQAEDMLQETFLKAWLALPKLKLHNLNFPLGFTRLPATLLTITTVRHTEHRHMKTLLNTLNWRPK